MKRPIIGLGTLISAVGARALTERLPGQTGTFSINGIDIPIDTTKDTSEDLAKCAAGYGIRLRVMPDGLTFNPADQYGDHTFQFPHPVSLSALLAESDAIVKRLGSGLFPRSEAGCL